MGLYGVVLEDALFYSLVKDGCFVTVDKGRRVVYVSLDYIYDIGNTNYIYYDIGNTNTNTNY